MAIEAFYLFKGFKKKKEWLKDHLGSLSDQELQILKILANPPFKIAKEKYDLKVAIDATYNHWAR